MSYALRQQHGLPGELKREHALFTGIGSPSSSLQSTPLPMAKPRSTVNMTIATNNGTGGRATATQAAVSSDGSLSQHHDVHDHEDG